jgi:GWxTD domain-containing protein
VECFGYDWPKEEVPYIITDEERAAFYQLKYDEERNAFIEQFWLRRDLSPNTLRNEMRDEYYRRILYANQNFSTKDVPGWRTDRGRIYEKYGAPDAIRKTAEQSSPTEVWTYRFLDDLQPAPTLTFADQCRCGDYRLSAEDELRRVLFRRLPFNPTAFSPQPAEVNGLQLYVVATRFPGVRLKDLEELVTHHVAMHTLPFESEWDFTHVTKKTVQVPITLKFRTSDLTWVENNGKLTAHVQLFGRWTSMTGHIVQTFENEITFDKPAAPDSDLLLLKEPVYINDGLYRLAIVVKDVNSQHFGTKSEGLKVPGYDSCLPFRAGQN